jgi:hypothetical protein
VAAFEQLLLALAVILALLDRFACVPKRSPMALGSLRLWIRIEYQDL